MMVKFPIYGYDEQSYYSLPAQERLVLIAAYLVDYAHVKEEGGNNRGSWVKKILASVGLSEGNPWCAATVSYCMEFARIKTGPKLSRAAVKSWARWARGGRDPKEARRGDLYFYLRPSGLGHIEIVTSVNNGEVMTIGGNTGPDGGRDGDGMYRKVRPMRKPWRVIKWTEE